MTLQTYSVVFPRVYKTAPEVPPFVRYLLSWFAKNKGVYIVLNAGDSTLDLRRMSRSYRRSELEEFVILQRKWFSNLNQERLAVVETEGKSVAQVHQLVVQAWKNLASIP